MNERITEYLDEVYGKNSQDAKAVENVVESFEKKYGNTVRNVLAFNEEDNYGEESYHYQSLALFCDTYWVTLSLQPEIWNRIYFCKYPDDVNYIETIKKLNFRGTSGNFYFPEVLGHPHWAMDVIRMNILPHFQ